MRPKKLDKMLSNLASDPSENLDRRIATLIALAERSSHGHGSAKWTNVVASRKALSPALKEQSRPRPGPLRPMAGGWEGLTMGTVTKAVVVALLLVGAWVTLRTLHHRLDPGPAPSGVASPNQVGTTLARGAEPEEIVPDQAQTQLSQAVASYEQGRRRSHGFVLWNLPRPLVDVST